MTGAITNSIHILVNKYLFEIINTSIEMHFIDSLLQHVTKTCFEGQFCYSVVYEVIEY